MPRKRKAEERIKGNFSSTIMKNAMDDCKVTKNIRKTAAKFGLCHTTLLRYIKKNEGREKEILEPNYAVNKVFNADLEKQLKEYLVTASKMHFGLTKVQAKELAYELAVANNCKFPKSWSEKQAAGEDWLKSFRKRWPDISIRKPEATSLARATAFNKTTVNEFFDNIEKIYKKTSVTAAQVYNLDETGLTTVHVPPNVLAKTGEKQVGQVTSGERGILITACCFISAAGNTVPPFLIFPRVNFKPHMLNGAPSGSAGSACKSGWMNKEIFLQVMKHFVDHVRPTSEYPAVLVYDNHESHVQAELIKMARENNIHIVTIPPHTSSKLQPLDVSVYKSLKNFYNAECNSFMLSHPSRTISIYDVANLFGKAYSKAFSMSNIVSGFRATGIWPFDRNIFNEDEFLSSYVTDRLPSLPSVGTGAQDDEVPVTSGTPPVASLPEVSTASTSAQVVSPVEIRPFPKAQARKSKSGGRKRGKTTILTATPAKVDEVKEDDQGRTPVKRKLFDDSTNEPSGSETETESVYHSESEDSGGDFIEDSNEEEDGDDDEVNIEDLIEGQFVVVKEGIGKGRYCVFSVGEITKVTVKFVTVQYMQPRKSAFVKTDNSYTWEKQQIAKILPSPKTGTTKRSSSLFYFPFNFAKFGLKL